MATSSIPTPTAPVSKFGMILGILKYLLPVAASAASIWLHNKQTAAKVQSTVDIVTGTIPQ